MAKGSKNYFGSKAATGKATQIGPQTNGAISAPKGNSIKGSSLYGSNPKGYSK
jgi:hypothetical protein